MKRTISVTGSATVSVEPDIARLACGVNVTGANAHDALRRANEAMTAIIGALKAVGVASADLRTAGPNLYPSERGYNASNDVSVVVRDVGSVGAVIDAVAAAGGPNLTLHGVSFAVSDPAPHLSAARRAAMGAARAIADELAEAGGAQVGEVVTISESGGHHVFAESAAYGMRAMKATPVEAGSEQIRSDVNVTYRLVDPA